MKYAIKEGFNGFGRAPFSMMIAIFTITLSLIILGSFTIVYTNANSLVQQLRNRVEFEAFLSDSLPEQNIVLLQNLVLKVNGVEKVTYFSKDDALKLFKNEFGEDVEMVVGFNPLPASFKIDLKNDYKNSDSISIVSNKIKSFVGIEDIKYRKKLLEIIDKRSKTFLQLSLALGSILLIASFFLVSNTIRLIILSKKKIITTMRLVGATKGFVRTPFILQGILQGIIGGSFATLILFFTVYALKNFFGENISEIINVKNNFYFAIFTAGVLLGFSASLFSIRKFLKNKISD